MACTCSCCAARVWASLNNELLIGWGSGTPCGAKPGMRTEGCAILDSSGWVVRTRGHKRVARVAVGRYDVEQPGAGVGHAEREDNGRRFAPLVASGEAYMLCSCRVCSFRPDSVRAGFCALKMFCISMSAGPVELSLAPRTVARSRRNLGLGERFSRRYEQLRCAKGSSVVVRNSERSRRAGYLRLAAYELLVSENNVMRK